MSDKPEMPLPDDEEPKDVPGEVMPDADLSLSPLADRYKDGVPGDGS